VTTVVGIKDKPGPLTQWAANCAADMMIQKRDQHVESVLASMPPEMSEQASHDPGDIDRAVGTTICGSSFAT
jgi:hypothetical protein